MTANINEECFSNLSYNLTKIIKKKEKQDNGIYFTPPKTIVRCLDILSKHRATTTFNNILEPSCGSCEFIDKIKNYYPTATITGVEYNKTIYENIKNKYDNNSDNIKIVEADFLKTAYNKYNEKYDLIIGNPPYYVIKKTDVDKQYYNYFEGRPNIFILFIIKSLSLLTDDGILCFILPKSFLNCLYYNKTRKHIYDNYLILSIIECDDNYIDTEQPTIIFIIQKNDSMDSRRENDKYILKHLANDYIIFSTCEVIERLNELYINATTLNILNFKVFVGNIVWNENKSLLTDDPLKTRLIYSTDIINNTLSIKNYTNNEKKNYINKKGSTESLLVINRGYGVGNYNFEYSLINCEFTDGLLNIIEYLIENHLICIRYEGQADTELIDKYVQIYRSFSDERTVEFIKLYFGNSAINTTELLNILPIYL
uniref:site-specific DNA-methyltransferase (adenine-specific) n=1 Tax=viral metagenome TaxID=1070528 RepID=A0A6C0L9C4_9ZZZZ